MDLVELDKASKIKKSLEEKDKLKSLFTVKKKKNIFSMNDKERIAFENNINLMREIAQADPDIIKVRFDHYIEPNFRKFFNSNWDLYSTTKDYFNDLIREDELYNWNKHLNK